MINTFDLRVGNEMLAHARHKHNTHTTVRFEDCTKIVLIDATGIYAVYVYIEYELCVCV